MFGKSFCFNESDFHRKSKHFPFQCACNEYVTLASYAKGFYNAYEVERMEEFIVFILRVHLKLVLILSIKLMSLINAEVLLYLNIVLITIRMKILILLNISIGFFLTKNNRCLAGTFRRRNC